MNCANARTTSKPPSRCSLTPPLDGFARPLQQTGAYGIALRDREYCASRPDLAGFDAFALEADDLETLRQLASRCDELGIAHNGVQDRSAYGASLDIPDPDGTVLRFLANNPFNPGTFLGVEFTADGTPQIYQTPRFQ